MPRYILFILALHSNSCYAQCFIQTNLKLFCSEAPVLIIWACSKLNYQANIVFCIYLETWALIKVSCSITGS